MYVCIVQEYQEINVVQQCQESASTILSTVQPGCCTVYQQLAYMSTSSAQ